MVRIAGWDELKQSFRKAVTELCSNAALLKRILHAALNIRTPLLKKLFHLARDIVVSYYAEPKPRIVLT